MAKNQNNNVAPATQKTEPEAKKDALATALAQIEKQFGKGAVMKLGDNASMQVDAISTGSLGLDLALGVGGVPRGRIIEVYGPESSGKTTLALHILAEAQKKGGEVAFIDVEHALDPTYAEALGVDINNLLVSQPDTGEQAMEMPKRWAWTSTICWSASRTPASRPWRSAKHWCAPVPSMPSWWTRLPPWCRGLRSRAKWATAMWACRPA